MDSVIFFRDDVPFGVALERGEMVNSTRRIIEIFGKRGLKAWLVGGAVRDLLMGSSSCDIDVAVLAEPDRIAELLPEAVRVGRPPHCTYTLRLGRVVVDIAAVVGGNIEADLARRDFTINAMAMDADGVIIDPWGGRSDLEDKLLRFTGSPEDRLREDPVRALRLCRFAATLGLRIDEDSSRSVRTFAAEIPSIPGERIGKEVYRCLSGDLARFLELAEEHDLLPHIFPVFEELRRCNGDIWKHSLRAVRLSQRVNCAPEVVTAVLMLHVGRPSVGSRRGMTISFPGEARAGEVLARLMLANWGWPRNISRSVPRIVLYQRKPGVHLFARSIVHLYRKMGRRRTEYLFEVARVESLASGEKSSLWEKNLTSTRALHQKLDDARYLLGGKDIMILLGLGEGPEIGAILFALDMAVVRGEIENRYEAKLWVLRTFSERANALLHDGRSGGSML